MKQRKIKIFTFLVYIFGFWLLLFGFCRASPQPSASLFFAPVSGTFGIGENFNIGVRISSPNETMNAAQGTIAFSNDILEVVRISRSNSLFTLWPQEPTFSNENGTINFAGGLPNPGFKGESTLIFTITFHAKKQGTALVSFTSGTVLANDGFGTDITKTLGSGHYVIVPREMRPIVPSPAPPVTTVPLAPVVSSPTHPDQNKWYAKREVEFRWNLPKDVNGVSFLFNQYLDSQPGNISDGLMNSKTFTAKQDGVWDLHIKFRNEAGWGAVTHFKTQIDTEPPLPFSIFIKEDTKTTNTQPTLIFEASDVTSGIDYYEISVDETNPIIWRKTDKEMTFKIPKKLTAGKHKIKVKAFDLAGNFQTAEKEIEIIESEPPLIEFITSKLWSGDTAVVEGSAPPKMKLIIKIKNEKTGVETKYETESDEKGHWFFIFREGLPTGRHSFSAALVTPEGIEGKISEPLLIIVLRPIVFYLWIISIVISLIIIIILSLFALYYRKKSKLKKKHK